MESSKKIFLVGTLESQKSYLSLKVQKFQKIVPIDLKRN